MPPDDPTARTRPPRRRRPLVVALLPALVAAAVAVVLVAPAGAGLAGRWPWVALLAFRGAVGAAALVAGVVVALLALAARRLTPPGARAGALALAALALVGVATAGGQLTVLAVRGLHDTAPTSAAPRGSLTVLEVNTDHSRVDPAVLARLDERAGADVVTMPETEDWLAREVAHRLSAAGHPVQVFSVPSQGQVLPTSLLVSDDLGRYRQTASTGQGAGLVVAEPVGADAASRPRIVAAHPQAPVRSSFLAQWRSGASRAVGLCSRARDAVLAGDFNSTLDHPPLRDSGTCADAALATGTAGTATWPQRLPRLLGAPLDHVFATSSRWRPAATWTEPLPGSDHRALLARLVPVGTTGS